MFIIPMEPIQLLNNKSIDNSQINSGKNSPFEDILSSAIDEVKATQQKVNEDIYLLATGQSDDLHNLGIDSTKAQLSLQMLVQLRNKAMDSYTELMRINL